MTISTSASAQIFLGNGSLTSFQFSFIAGSSSNIIVYFVDSDGSQTLLLPTQYTLTLNPAAPGALWGIGGTVVYPTAGPAITNTQSLIVDRVIPFTQNVSISNQGPFAPQVIEQALDTLCLEIQQVAARTGQLRGTWATDVQYNFGDVVQDGPNGTNTTNLYMCANANISGVWANDLAAGYWVLALNIQAISASISSRAGGTNGQIQYNSGGALQGFTMSGDVTVNTTTGVSAVGANKITNAQLAQAAANTIKGNNTGVLANETDIAIALSSILGRAASGNITNLTLGTLLSLTGTVINCIAPGRLLNVQTITSSGTYTKTAGTNSQYIELWGGGGGGSTGGNGGDTTFDVMTAGGGKGSSGGNGSGGSSSGGDLNAKGGGGGSDNASGLGGGGGNAAMGGGGGKASASEAGGFPGGGGSCGPTDFSGGGAGYCAKYYSAAVTGITLTIGSGGTSTGGGVGAAGCARIWEYS